jgi:glyoxylase-like metal-dependent hydrolase (beta-lactamase superfamily II)
MADASITYFPVRNGDTGQIRLSDGTNGIVDSNITEESRDPSVKDRYNVHGHLLEEVRKVDGTPHVDAFILTHPDDDHCRGFKDTFYAGDPSKYDEPAAKEQYENAVGSSNFFVTSELPDEDEPLPLVFLMSGNGPVRGRRSRASGGRSPQVVLGGAAAKQRTYG